MAVTTNAVKMARLLAIIQIITGSLLVIFGIADRRVKGRSSWRWTGDVYFGIWIGVWMCITGVLGIPGSGREKTSSRNAFAGVFMVFSITIAVLGGVIIICYSIALSEITDYNNRYHRHHYKYGRDYTKDPSKLAIVAIMLVLGIVTFAIGIGAVICTCLMKICSCNCCCKQPQEYQQMHNYPAGGYIMTQMSGGVPVAVPMQAMQAGDGGAATQGYHQPMVLVPVSGASGGQQLFVKSALPDGMAMGTQQQKAEMPSSSSHGGYVPMEDGQVQMNV